MVSFYNICIEPIITYDIDSCRDTADSQANRSHSMVTGFRYDVLRFLRHPGVWGFALPQARAFASNIFSVRIVGLVYFFFRSDFLFIINSLIIR